MNTGWIARVEDLQSQERLHTLFACPRAIALKRCEEMRKKNETMKVELIGPYTEILESLRETKTVVSQNLEEMFKEQAGLNPLLIERDGQNFKIEVDKVD